MKGGHCRQYIDKGYSGKNTVRPRFQELVRDIEQGLISKVVVYKLDRISRSIIDFSNMMELFQKHDVEFVSSTEKFDTSTPMGRAMLNICIVLAQLERETIQKRVTDSYYSRCQKGFHMSGRAPYGFRLEPTVVEGIRTKMLVPEPEKAARVRLMFEMYTQPDVSFGDVTRHFAEQGISFNGGELQRCRLSRLLRNPTYTQVDPVVYDFFKSQSAVIVNDPADFTSSNGCYLFQGRDVAAHKDFDLKNQILVIAPHEGLIPSDVWLACRKKLLTNSCIGGTNHKAKNTWLAGKVKCGRCGAGLMVIGMSKTPYFRCRKRADSKSCEGCGTLRVREVEEVIHGEMVQRLAAFQTLTRKKPNKANPKLSALQVELAQVETEIEKLLDTLTGANAVLLNYANSKIEALDAKRQSLSKAIADASVGAVSPEQLERISGLLNNWDGISFEDRRLVVDGLISVIRATGDSAQIEWTI